MLHGRSAEQTALAELVEEALAGRSGALVVRGEAGIGKSALLEWAAERAAAAGLRVVRVTGIEAEADLAFAGLAGLLWPLQARLDRLPEPQALALRSVLGGPAADDPTDRFKIGLAVLTLLADLAEEQPVYCLVDDAQWLDRASADALTFAARRLGADGVAVVFAGREEGFAAPGLTEVRPARLGEDDAARLLGEYGVAPAVRERVLAEAEGNPLALREFAAVAREGSGVEPLPVADRVLAAFLERIAELPERTQTMLLLAAASAGSGTRAVLAAGEVLGVGLGDLQPAERAGLIRVSDTGIAFRHPLIATAAYRGMPMAQRVSVHRALAETATDPDTRALHLPLMTLTPDEAVAGELVAAGERARRRTACATAGSLYGQAARLTPDPGARAARLAEAAALALSGGEVDRAADLADQVRVSTAARMPLAAAARVRAAVEFERGDPADAAAILVDAATGGLPREEAAGMLRTAAEYAWFAAVPDAVTAAAERLDALGEPDPGVRGLAALIAGDYATGVGLLRQSAPEDGGLRMRAVHHGWIMGDDAATLARASEEVARCRRYGLVGALPDVLQVLAQVQVVAGAHRDAEASVAEAAAIARDTGARQRAWQLDTVVARIAAVEGDEERCLELTGLSTGTGRVAADTMVALLDLGLGRPEKALERLLTAWRGPGGHAGVLMGATGDLVEAAVRADEREQAAEPLRRFRAWAAAGGQPWALSMAERCLALLTEDEAHFARAVRLHEGTSRPFERARTELLYGEWLRRARRRADARDLLKAALETFDRLRARPWAERARAELRAAGGSASAPAAAALLDRLTPQELQVVRLAAEGASSREIGAKLFLSPRTIEYHLYKAYPKLGISSRRELNRLDLG
ncbi:helix-turn-helix transcriptional regulator [Nonomuraea typhae]|uniref:helix-turn-helix transcriptional regulator n=1 Tax=Nonomuraea typhae TaxID=2603600 RepID=UPI0012F84D35|nr:LuxR family transcriptional regulator [Nonomuraea typhae]